MKFVLFYYNSYCCHLIYKKGRTAETRLVRKDILIFLSIYRAYLVKEILYISYENIVIGIYTSK